MPSLGSDQTLHRSQTRFSGALEGAMLPLPWVVESALLIHPSSRPPPLAHSHTPSLTHHTHAHAHAHTHLHTHTQAHAW